MVRINCRTRHHAECEHTFPETIPITLYSSGDTQTPNERPKPPGGKAENKVNNGGFEETTNPYTVRRELGEAHKVHLSLVVEFFPSLDGKFSEILQFLSNLLLDFLDKVCSSSLTL